MADRPATVADLHAIAAGMPGVTREAGTGTMVAYQVSRRSFVFFRNPRPDAVDPTTGERLDDVVVIWVASEEDKQSLLADPDLPFFTTPHFDGHPSVLLRCVHLDRLTRDELAEFVYDAWLARAGVRARRAWLDERGLSE